MSQKQKQPDLDLQLVFHKSFAAANASKDLKDVIVKFLKATKIQLERTSANKLHKPAKSFTLEDAVDYFNLTYGLKYSDSLHFHWKIETLPDVKEMQPSAYLSSFLAGYTANYDRSSEAAYRVSADVIIAYCLAELRSRVLEPTAYGVLPIQPTTLAEPRANIKAFCDISFTHSINDTDKRFHSLLLCVQAKLRYGNLGSACDQLVTYLAGLRESRINRGKTDSSVYGVATDGLKYLFVTITNEGVLLFSRQFDVMSGDLPVVLGCLCYILESATIAMSSIKSSKSRVLQNEVDDDADEGLDPYGSSYVEADGDDDESDGD